MKLIKKPDVPDMKLNKKKYKCMHIFLSLGTLHVTEKLISNLIQFYNVINNFCQLRLTHGPRN